MLDYSKEKESMGEQVDPFDLTKKQEADLQRIRQFRLIDDVFMNKVFEDKSCVELLLQIILDRTDLHVENVNLQHGISNLQGRAVRLDILAVDDSGKIYNIEVQKNDHRAQAKRARYIKGALWPALYDHFSGPRYCISFQNHLPPEYPAGQLFLEDC